MEALGLNRAPLISGPENSRTEQNRTIQNRTETTEQNKTGQNRKEQNTCNKYPSKTFLPENSGSKFLTVLHTYCTKNSYLYLKTTSNNPLEFLQIDANAVFIIVIITVCSYCTCLKSSSNSL